MLIIGVGGSGGKTLRFIRRELQRKLLESGWNRGFPEGWQLVQIDSPIVQDGAEKGLAEDLPAKDYVGVAVNESKYHFFEQQMLNVVNQAGELESVAGWLPPSQAVHQIPAHGAGQFRAIGRVVYAAGINRIAERIQTAVSALQRSTESHAELARVLGAHSDGSPPSPLAIVISSVAGGSGAGMTLDVCDLLRHMGGQESWLGNPIAIMYAPDVFEGLGDQATSGVAPNALATISEMMAAKWDSTGYDPSSNAFITASGVMGNMAGQNTRGPSYSIMVGRKNKALTLADQVAVYRAVGTNLAVVASNYAVQDQFRAYALGNALMSSGAGSQVGVPFIPLNAPKPTSAMGFAALGLGRDLFAAYGSERAARMVVEHLQQAHWDDDVKSGKSTPDEARDKVVDQDYDLFVGACQLSERSTENNQILDAIRDPESVRSDLTEVKNAVLAALRSYDQLTPREWSTRIEGQVSQREDDFTATRAAIRHKKAAAWVEFIQPHVADTVSRFIGQRGLPVTAELLRRLSLELREVVGELETEAAESGRKAGESLTGIGRRLGEWAADMMKGDNELVASAASDGIKKFWHANERETKLLTAQLIDDFRASFLEPLRDAVANASTALALEMEGSPGSPSAYDLWPERGLPSHMTPAANEFLLEPSTTFPEAFEEKVTQTTGARSFVAGVGTLVTEIASGQWPGLVRDDHEVEHQVAITVDRSWVPREASVRADGVPEQAVFDLRFSLEHVLDRAREWIYQDARAMGMYVRETLTQYLTPGSHLKPAEVKRRQDAFGDMFAKALQAAEPLVDVNEELAQRLYGSARLDTAIVMTPLPLESGSPARKIAESTLITKGGVAEEQVGTYFGSVPQSRIDITQMLAAPCDPVVFDSFTSPIRADWGGRITDPDRTRFWTWRRSRSLDKFVPVPPETLDAMVRGWLTGLILGYIPGDATGILDPSGKTLRFPAPLLGEPPANSGDRLAALLESMPLAIIEFGAHNYEPAEAYQRLADIGDVQARELSSWISTGAPEPGMPVPNEAVAGPAGAEPGLSATRSNTILDLLEKTSLDVKESAAVRGPARDRAPSGRAWELENQFLAAVLSLEEHVRNASTTGGGGLLS